MPSLILRAVGIVIYLALLGCFGWLLVRKSTSAGLRKPVIVGACARIAVLLTAHLASVVIGSHGFFYQDDGYYLKVGQELAHAWQHGLLPDPAGYRYVGTSAFGYPLFVAILVLLAGKSVLAVTAANVLLGTASVYLAGSLAERWFGVQAGVRAAWLLALFPTMLWWTAPALKENLAVFLLLAAITGAARSGDAANGSRALVPLIALGTVRLSAAVAVTLGLIAGRTVLVLRSMRRDTGVHAVRMVASGAAVAAVAVFVVARGQPLAFVHSLRDTLAALHSSYGSGHVGQVAVDATRALVSPYPWVFTHATFDWDLALYPGIWCLIMLYPTAARGVWALRGRRDLLVLLLVPIVTYVILNAFAIGLASRERSAIEPLILLLAVAGWESSRSVVHRAALALAIAAPVVLVQTRSPVGPTVVLAVASLLAVTARWIPRSSLDAAMDPVRSAALGPLYTSEGIRRGGVDALAGVSAVRAHAPRCAAAGVADPRDRPSAVRALVDASAMRSLAPEIAVAHGGAALRVAPAGAWGLVALMVRWVRAAFGRGVELLSMVRAAAPGVETGRGAQVSAHAVALAWWWLALVFGACADVIGILRGSRRRRIR